MKEFAVYTALRIGLFVASYALIAAIYLVATSGDELPILWPFILAFALSGVASYFLLNGPREAFARHVQEKAERASARMHEIKSREDVD
ncbi:DUF4229 domain-containing protein [Nocardioides pacificus]